VFVDQFAATFQSPLTAFFQLMAVMFCSVVDDCVFPNRGLESRKVYRARRRQSKASISCGHPIARTTKSAKQIRRMYSNYSLGTALGADETTLNSIVLHFAKQAMRRSKKSRPTNSAPRGPSLRHASSSNLSQAVTSKSTFAGVREIPSAITNMRSPSNADGGHFLISIYKRPLRVT
jgi:hypothetical protein